MKLRPPSVPLITIDPYFSIWSNADRLTDTETTHWTGAKQPLTGIVTVDGAPFRFMGVKKDVPVLAQTDLTVTACTSRYTLQNDLIRLTAAFTSPLLLDDPELCSRPVSFLELTAESADGKAHDITLQITMDDSVCLNEKFQYPTVYQPLSLPGLTGAGVGAAEQHILNRSGDDLRIDWGTAFLATDAPNANVQAVSYQNADGVAANDICLTVQGTNALVAFAYDDVRSIRYFGEDLPSYWNRNGKTIQTALTEAFADYADVKARCDRFALQLQTLAGSGEYYDLLSLAYRQVIAAHKLAVTADGSLLFISKECFSNGCAATVDVSYPSVPLFLLFQPELVNAMLRPIFKFADSEAWPYAFAPHDAGQYPLVGGQVYGENRLEYQMPVEECGNMLICVAAAALAAKDTRFAEQHWDDLERWAVYLLENGADPENQLCTDDFAGHLAHNCNLALKTIMDIAAFGILHAMRGQTDAAKCFLAKAREMAASWIERARDDETVFRLAFDRPGTWSMKYNAVWDAVFGTGDFPAGTFDEELQLHLRKHLNAFGLPLDNRAAYTKSDWLLWTAAMADGEGFDTLLHTLWTAYHESPSRVPLTDWYDTETAQKVGFQNRTVQGGLFMKALRNSGKCSVPQDLFS